MAQRIKMTPDTMRRRAKETDAQLGKFIEIENKMDKLLNNLKAEWEGEAMKGYEERYRKIKSTAFKSVKELFEEISHNLTKSAEIVEKADAEIGRQYRG